MKQPSKVHAALNLAALVAMIAASVAMIWSVAKASPPETRPPTTPSPKAPVSIEGAPVLGVKSAKLVMIEFGDFECPACAQFAKQQFRTIVDTYVKTGKILFAFRNFPLPKHQNAKHAAEAADCAGKQGRFWEMYEAQYAAAPQLELANLRVLATRVGVQVKEFDKCMAGPGRDSVARDVEDAGRLALRGTPTFMIGRLTAEGRVAVTLTLGGVVPLESLQRIVDPMLK